MNQSRRLHRVAELFESARSLGADEREAYLSAEAPDDPALRDEVRKLLKHHESADGVLGVSSISPALMPEPPDILPATINGYTIKRRIGMGGMGMVYLAQQRSPKREVAIKVIRPGHVTRELLKRFELEGAMLGRLQHPNIAQIHEAGQYVDESGTWPYLAMEYIDGVPILEYAKRHSLSVRDRLEMFAKVCDAVHHAHQRGVIHRDLKPGNVLVDGAAQPKVLDFGVARAIEPDLNATTMHTAAGRLVGTLAYMSPEQVLGRAGDIDTRSDVYGLGVVMYELLTGRLPYDLEDRAITGAARVISEQEPTSLTTIDRFFRGDLDTIVRKSLDKDPNRRYKSVSDLAGDIRRHLNTEPIMARPATTIYQLSRFARRNKALIAGVGVAMVALVAGFAVATTYAIGQTRALAESERQRSIAEAINSFLTVDLTQQVDPNRGSEDQITLVEAIDRATARIEGRFADAPLVEANLRRTIGTAYRSRHRLDDAQTQLSRALYLYRQHLGARSEDALLCRMELNAIHIDRADFRAAESAMRELLSVQREALGEDHTQTMASIGALSGALTSDGRFEEAVPLLEELIERRTRVLGPTHVDTALAMNNLAVVYTNMARNAEAATMLERILPIQRAEFGDRHPDTIQSVINLGMTYSRLQRDEEAIDLIEEGVSLRKVAFGDFHPRTLSASNSLAVLYGRAGRYEEQESLLVSTLAAQERELGPEHINTLNTRMNLTWVAYRLGKYEQAHDEYAVITECLNTLFPDHFLGGVSGMMQGRCLTNMERFEEAEKTLTRAYEHFVNTLGNNHPLVYEVAGDLKGLYTQWERPNEAKHWQDIASTPD